MFIIIYKCQLISDPKNLKISEEHFDLGFFSISDIDNMKLHDEYIGIIKRLIGEE